jgi:hypothetical protein
MMTFDNGATHGQPNTHAAVLGCVKGFEKLVQVLSPKTHAGILHCQAHMITKVSFGSDYQLPRTIVYAAHRVGSIHKQIQYDLLKLDTIAGDRRQVVGKFDPRNHLASLKFTSRQRNHLSNGLIQVHRFGRRVPLAKKGAQSRDYLGRTVAIPNRALRGLARAIDVWRVGIQHPQTGAGVGYDP